jgi:hypothetical protein
MSKKKIVDDFWCTCPEKDQVPVPYDYRPAVQTHGFECARCGKVIQVG